MAIRECDLQLLNALKAARAQHKRLAPLLDFYHDLYLVQFQAKADLPQPVVRDEMARRWRLEGGIPQLTFDQLHVEPGQLEDLVAWVVDVFVWHSHPVLQVDDGDWARPGLVDLARQIFESWEISAGPGSGLGQVGAGRPGGPVLLAVAFALVPYLQRAAETILPCLDLTLWPHGHCPICGGRPDLALATEGAWHLVCSRCTATWDYVLSGCPFCTSSQIQVYQVKDLGYWRLHGCQDCTGYLKVVTADGRQQQVEPLVERLLSVGLDLVARQEGYG